MQEDFSFQSERLKFFPIMMFAIVMGMGGLTIMYQKAALFLSVPTVIGTVLMACTTALFLVIALMYGIKCIVYTNMVQKEFAHPIRVNFFAAASISALMLAIIYKEQYPFISALFWYPGTLLHFFLTLHTISFWMNHNQELDHSNPAWFIPVVGNVLVPIAGIGFAPHSVLVYFLSVGLFFWLALFAILLNRIIFHHPLGVKFMPTMFIFIAPPSVSFIAYVKMFETVDTFATILFNVALFFTILVGFMYKNFIKIKFFISWWAFVFPLAAMAISAMLMHHHSHELWHLIVSYLMVCITTLVILIVIYQTILHVKKGEICIQE